MKNEIKILIAALVVILIVLVGAFALSGSNSPQPTATPTALPVTATPTPVPANDGGTGNVTPAPTVAPTVTPVPSVTPTPVPESGVKQTEFGYWITYPPLDPQKWSDPKPLPEWNVVYFDPTSDSVELPIYEAGSLSVKEPDSMAVVYRIGDLGNTTHVRINSTTSDNVRLDELGTWYWIGGDNLDFIDYEDGVATWDLTFAPGVTQQTVHVWLGSIYDYNREGLGTLQAYSFSGFVQLEIVDVDEPYHVGGQDTFTVSIGEMPIVYFDEYEAGLWVEEGVIDYTDGVFGSVNTNGDIVYVTIPVVRDGGSGGALNVYFDWDVAYSSGDPFPADALTIQPFAFGNGQNAGYLTVGIDKDVILNNENEYYLEVYIEDTEDYLGDDEFYIHINDGYEEEK